MNEQEFDELVLAIKRMLPAREDMTRAQRSYLASSVMNRLGVPGTTWSPEDYMGFIELMEEVPEERREEVANAAYDAHYDDSSRTEDEWYMVKFFIDQAIESAGLEPAGSED